MSEAWGDVGVGAGVGATADGSISPPAGAAVFDSAGVAGSLAGGFTSAAAGAAVSPGARVGDEPASEGVDVGTTSAGACVPAGVGVAAGACDAAGVGLPAGAGVAAGT